MALPNDAKIDAGPLVAPANQSLTAEEFNALYSAVQALQQPAAPQWLSAAGTIDLAVEATMIGDASNNVSVITLPDGLYAGQYKELIYNPTEGGATCAITGKFVGYPSRRMQIDGSGGGLGIVARMRWVDDPNSASFAWLVMAYPGMTYIV